jgi:TatD DNase family protein
MSVFTDSHCHLAMYDGASDALRRARGAGVHGFLVPSTRLDDMQASVTLAEQHGDVWAAIGFHPHEAKDFDDAARTMIESMVSHDRVVAVGEIGLDYHYDHSPREVQRDVFMRQLALARAADLPVIIHNRESTPDLLDLLESEQARGSRGVLHSFTESYEVASRLVGLGYYIAFSGILTFRTAESLRDVAARLPRERVLIETDTPYLAPVPHRGKTNEPAFVVRIAEHLAGLWSTSVEEAGEITTRNFEEAFAVTVQR